MNVSLDNPYGSVVIPRAKLRPADDSTVIVNPMALESNATFTSSANPYAGEADPKDEQSQSPPAYNGQKSYTLKEDTEEVGRCRACCWRCRRQK